MCPPQGSQYRPTSSGLVTWTRDSPSEPKLLTYYAFHDSLCFDCSFCSQNILKFVIPFGEVVSFKYLLHNTGTERGEPRGYCFVEFSTKEVYTKDLSIIVAFGSVRSGRFPPIFISCLPRVVPVSSYACVGYCAIKTQHLNTATFFSCMKG